MLQNASHGYNNFYSSNPFISFIHPTRYFFPLRVFFAPPLVSAAAARLRPFFTSPSPPRASSSPVSSFRRTRPPPTAAAMYQVLNDAVTPATIIIMPGSIETKCIQADPLPVITMMISMAIKATP